MSSLHRSPVVTRPKLPLNMKTVKTSYIFCYVLALLWENQQIQARGTQEQQEIFVHDILRPMTSEHLPTIMYLEQVKPYYSPWYLAVLSNNNFVFMEMYTLCASGAA